MEKYLTVSPNVRLGGEPSIIENFWWSPLNRKLSASRAGILIV